MIFIFDNCPDAFFMNTKNKDRLEIQKYNMFVMVEQLDVTEKEKARILGIHKNTYRDRKLKYGLNKCSEE